MVSIVNTTEEEVVKVINSYKRISRLFFKFGIYFIVLLSSFGVLASSNFDKNLSITSSINENPGIDKEGNKINGNQVYFSGDYSYSGFDVNVFRGYFKYTGDTITSYKNIVSNSGVVLPNKFKGNISDFNFTFSSGDYTAKEMRDILEKLVLKDFDISTSIKTTNLTKKGDNLKDKFFLTCKDSSFRFINSFCKVNINNFLDSLYFQNILDTKDKFKELSKTFLDSKYKKPFCESIMNYVYYNYEAPKFLSENVVDKCGNDYEEKFNKIKAFKEADLELEENIYSKKTYNWNKLNEFKLITYQNRIYNSFNGGSKDLNLVNGYLSHLEGALSKDKISDLYKNLAYFYNNKYLKHYLKNLKNSSRISNSDREEAGELLDLLKNLNKSDIGIGYNGLENGDVDGSLISFFDKNRENHSVSMINTFSLKDAFNSYINNFSDFTVLDRNINKDNNTVNTSLSIDLSFKEKELDNKKIELGIEFNYINNGFLVKSIGLQDSYSEIEKIIQSKIGNDGMGLGDVKNILKSNMSLSDVKKFSFCKRVENMLDENFGNNKKIEISIKGCSENEVQLKKGDLKYKINFDENKINSVEINNDYIQKKSNKLIGDKSIIKSNSLNYISSILSINKKDKEKIATSQLSSIYNKFDKYLDTKPAKISRKQGNKNIYTTYFKLKNIVLKGYLNLNENYKINNISIIFIKDGEIDKEIPLNGMSFYLISKDELKINNIKVDPINYIEKNYKKAFKSYKEYVES